jgi:malate synthase
MSVSATASSSAPNLTLEHALTPEQSAIISDDALNFVAQLAARFESQRQALLAARVVRQKQFDAGENPDFLAETKSIRESEWKVAAIPEDLQDRRTEITGPVERKMIINALNSGAKVFMADFEDSLTPTWQNVVDGQINLYDAVRRQITFKSPEGKEYKLNEKTATLIVRPRGWHLNEKHVRVNGVPVAGALFDFGVYFYLNAKEALARGTGPYFYLPKLESHSEAKLWADIFNFAEESLGLKRGTIKATVLIEVVTATFEMHEILHALKDYCVGLNCGRWDYIFSFIKKFWKRPDCVLPDRASVTMTTHFLRTYSKLLIQTCHKRGAFAMGGMSAFIPIKNDEAANEKALGMVRADKEREAGDGHDGTWVAHPALVPVAMEVFNRLMPNKNQLDKKLDVVVTAKDLLTLPEGQITEAGLRNNISVSVQYIANWLSGNGCVPINNLMEDAATAEIARSQIWQWIHHDKGVLADGRNITTSLYSQFLDEELEKIKAADPQIYARLPFDRAAKLLDELVTQPEFCEFLTLPGYQQVV